jgi:Uma2 family endonuclease
MLLETPVELHYKKFRFDDDEFFDFCTQNDELKFERDANGNIYVMPNTGGKTGYLNSALNAELYFWNKYAELGLVFDSSTAFRLPSSAVRSPDVAWISNERWNKLTEKEKEKFPPLCPDFVVELMSATDDEADLKKKIENEWIANGCQLAWLINPLDKRAFIYRKDGSIEQVEGFEQQLSGENVLPNFKLDLKIFQ